MINLIIKKNVLYSSIFKSYYSIAMSQQAAFVTSIQNFHLQSVESFQIEAIKEAFFCLSTKWKYY